MAATMFRNLPRYPALLLLLSCALLVQACQSAPATRATSETSFTSPSERTLSPELRLLMEEYAAAVGAACQNEPLLSDPGLPLLAVQARLACVRTQLLSSLGQSAEAEQYCTNDGLMLMVLCVLWGGTAVRIFEAAGEDPAYAMDWKNPLKSLAKALATLVFGEVAKCGDDRACLTSRIGRALNLDPVVVDRCSALPEHQGRCLGEELMMDQLRSALLYVG